MTPRVNCHFHFEYTRHIVPWAHPLNSELNGSVYNYCYSAPFLSTHNALWVHTTKYTLIMY